MKKLPALETLEHSVPEVILERSSRNKLSDLEPLEHSVPEVVLERSSKKELSALEPLEHSVLAGTSDSKHIRGWIATGPLEHSVPDLARVWTIDPFPERTAPESLDHSGLLGKEVEGRQYKCSNRTIVCIYSDIAVGDCVLYVEQATDSSPGFHSNLTLSS